MMAKYIDRFGFIHNEIDYKKELDRLYKKEFPTSDKENKPAVNEVKRFHRLINDNASSK